MFELALKARDAWLDSFPKTTRDHSDALMIAAAEAGSLEAMGEIANPLMGYKPIEMATTWGDRLLAIYQKQADSGDGDALVKLGDLLQGSRLTGDVDENCRRGFELLRGAAEKGNVKAMRELAKSYCAGIGVKESQKMADDWNAKASAAEKAAAVATRTQS